MTRSASSRSGARATTKAKTIAKRKPITAEELDALHDRGADLSPYVDYEHATRPGRAVQRVNVDFPVDLLRAIDREAARIGIARQAFIKLRIADAVAAAQTKDRP